MGDVLYCNFYFVIHTACYCMDAIHLNDNVWNKCLYAKVEGKLMSGMTTRGERAV